MARRRSLAALLLAGLLPVGLAGLAGCGGNGGTAIATGVVTARTVTETVDAPATLAARATGSVAATADGMVAQLLVADGERVRAGQVLMRLRSPAATRGLQQARAAVQAAAAPPAAPAAALPTTPPVDLTVASASLAASNRAAQRSLDAADAAARQLPPGPQRDAAARSVAQLRAQVTAAGATAAAALASVAGGLTAATAAARSAAGQLQATGGAVQDALGALAAAQREQARSALQAAQAGVDGLVVRAPLAGTVQLGTGSAAGAAPGPLAGLLASLPGSVPEALSGAGGSAAGGAATPAGPSAGGPVVTGSPVQAGGLLATVFDTSGLVLAADVDETDVLLVAPGTAADVVFDAVPGAHYRASVESVATSATASARGGASYLVRLPLAGGTLPDGSPAPVPRPGMSAVATLRVRETPDAPAVPAAALTKDGDRDSVWLVEAGRAVRRDVTLGAQGDDVVAVVAGLRPGDRVVVRGADAVHPGQDLR